jgi:hypothetical protein
VDAEVERHPLHHDADERPEAAPAFIGAQDGVVVLDQQQFDFALEIIRVGRVEPVAARGVANRTLDDIQIVDQQVTRVQDRSSPCTIGGSRWRLIHTLRHPRPRKSSWVSV